MGIDETHMLINQEVKDNLQNYLQQRTLQSNIVKSLQHTLM